MRTGKYFSKINSHSNFSLFLCEQLLTIINFILNIYILCMLVLVIMYYFKTIIYTLSPTM